MTITAFRPASSLHRALPWAQSSSVPATWPLDSELDLAAGLHLALGDLDLTLDSVPQASQGFCPLPGPC